MNSFNIRPARDGDLPVTANVLGVTAICATTGACFVAVATETGEIIGTVVVSGLKADNAVTVEQLYVHFAHRRKGIGSALLKRALRHAADNVAAAVELSVDSDNPARSLYRKFGFRETTITMQLRLSQLPVALTMPLKQWD